MKTKKCSKCGIEKPLTAEYYNRCKKTKSGFFSQCKACRAEYRKNNKAHITEYNAEYRKNNKKHLNAQNTEWRKNNKAHITEYNAEYRKKNKEAIAEYRKKNKEKKKKYLAKHRQKQIEKQPACVYQILNKSNGKIYIGETLCGEIRWKQHLWRLRSNSHINPKLQKDYDKFGEEAFEWSIIKEVDKDKPTLLLEEIRAIDSFLRQGKELYNLSLTIDQLKLLQEDK